VTVDRLDSLVQDDPLLCVAHLANQEKDLPSRPLRRRQKADGRASDPPTPDRAPRRATKHPVPPRKRGSRK
jgi:hypothetical protein